MGWHVLSSTYFDFDRFARESKADTLPTHLLPKIAARLGAEIHQPNPGEGSLLDRMATVIYGEKHHWAQARRVYKKLNDGDSVYAAGCDAGVPLAVLCAVRRRKVSFAIAFADTGRLRTRVVGRLLAALSLQLIAVVTTDYQARILNRSFGRRIQGVHAIEGQTDCEFFRPLPEPVVNEPRLVASCGAERRDYDTLARALGGLDLHVTVCFASPNLTSKTRYTMPEVVPENFDFEPLEFVELRNLYQRADVLVLPLLENRYSAGLTTLFEAIACGLPVVATRSPGIIDRLIDDDLMLGADAGDDAAIKAAVERILADPTAARARADEARRVVLEQYSSASFLDHLEEILKSLNRPRSSV